MKKTFVLTILLFAVALAAGLSHAQQAEQKDLERSIELPVMTFDLAAGPDRDKVNVFCNICHGTEYIPMQPRLSKAQWTATVTKMIKAFGAPVTEEDADRIVNYLAAAYGTGK